MKWNSLLIILSIYLFVVACKKDSTKTNAFDGAFAGYVKSINNGFYLFKYTKDGLLSSYTYTKYGAKRTAELEWETHQVKYRDEYPNWYIMPRNTAGYALNDQSTAANGSWDYDSNHQVVQLNGSTYFWSNGNIDSLTLGTAVVHYYYTADVENRNFGANFIPELTNFPQNNFRLKNLIDQVVILDAQRDTVSNDSYGYHFDNQKRVTKVDVFKTISGNTVNTGSFSYQYYE